MYNETITIFNRLGSRKDGDVWFPHILSNVCVYRDHAAIVASMGENSTDNVNIHIRIGKGMTASGYTYLLPLEWKRSDDHELTFTVKGGNEFDFIYCGVWPDTEVISDDMYQDGFFNHMRKTYDDVYSVTSCSDYSRSILPHLEVMGK